jgi:CubicO group peptidase (beta-lactamase class C family)
MWTKLLTIFITSFYFTFLSFCSTNNTLSSQDNNSPALDEYITPIKQWVDSGEIVGAEILILQSGDTLVHEVAGWRDRERKLPVEKNTICRVRSMTKPFVGTSILMLMEQEKLSLDDKASKYLSEFDTEECRDITIEQLLKHTAGFTQPGYPGWAADYDNLMEIVQALSDVGPTYTPGTRFSYSDGGTSTLAAIVTVVSGIPVEEFIQTRIFDLLGMEDSFCVLNEDDIRRPRISCTYNGSTGNWSKYWDNNNPPQVPFFRGSGGIFSTVSDYALFLSMWMNNGYWNSTRFLDPETVEMALTPSPESVAVNNPFGMHWQIYDDPVFSHTGSDGTLGSVDPSKELLVLYFTQSRGNDTLYRISDVISGVLANNLNSLH